MTRPEALSAIKTILETEYGVNVSDIQEHHKLKDEIGLDSLDIIDMEMELETETGVRIPDTDVANWVTVGDVVNSITTTK